MKLFDFFPLLEFIFYKRLQMYFNTLKQIVNRNFHSFRKNLKILLVIEIKPQITVAGKQMVNRFDERS